MKKLTVLLLSLVMIFSLSACGNDTPQKESSGDDTKENAEANSDFLADGLTVEMDGKKLSLPFKWSEIKDGAQSYYTDIPTELTYSDEHIGYYWKSRNGNGSQISVNVYNPNPETPISADEGLVCYIYLHTIMDDESKVDLVLPEGITFGDSYDDVIKAYGTPTSENSGDEVFSTTYESPDGKYRLELSYDDNKISGCTLEYNY